VKPLRAVDDPSVAQRVLPPPSMMVTAAPPVLSMRMALLVEMGE